MTSSLNESTKKTSSICTRSGQVVSTIFLLAVISLFTIRCSSSKEENLNAQSIETHNLAVGKCEEMEDKLQKLTQFSREPETSSNSVFLDSLNVLKKDFYNWKSNIVEVPGHAHDHHDHSDHEGHEHHHEPDPELTPQMILEIQQFMLAEIEKLNVRAEQLIKVIDNKVL